MLFLSAQINKSQINETSNIEMFYLFVHSFIYIYIVIHPYITLFTLYQCLHQKCPFLDSKKLFHL